ncbi:MAG TPA: hypothetical protein VHO24_17195 [Opitutaceae bacterium]|nr:hypothetical protein [Opitutaceae bacterium]
MPSFKQLAVAPVTYAVWAGLVVVAVAATYHVDPYVFAFTTFILGGISVVPVLAGIGVVLFAKRSTVSARTAIALSVAFTAAAVAVALEVLRGFKWA